MSITAVPDITIHFSADLVGVVSVTIVLHSAVAILMVMAYTFLLTSHFKNFILTNWELMNIDVNSNSKSKILDTRLTIPLNIVKLRVKRQMSKLDHELGFVMGWPTTTTQQVRVREDRLWSGGQVNVR